MKDHEIAQLVNYLTAIAIEYREAQSLRNAIRSTVLQFIEEYCNEKTNTAV